MRFASRPRALHGKVGGVGDERGKNTMPLERNRISTCRCEYRSWRAACAQQWRPKIVLDKFPRF